MLRMSYIDLSKRRLIRLLPCLFGGAVFAGAVWAGQPQTAAAVALGKQAAVAPTYYRVINLGPSDIPAFPAINAHGQVVYTLGQFASVFRAWFYDGKTSTDIGTLGGPSAAAGGVNDAGQVTGFSTLANSPFTHAFMWSRSSGMRDLGALFSTSSSAGAINNQGQVAGSSKAPDSSTHAFRWSAAEGMVDIGAFASGPGNFTNATAIGENGLVAGWGSIANGDGHAFAWTRKTGLLDLGTLGGSSSIAAAVDAEGQVAGTATAPGNLAHAFIWNRSGGMKDLGTFGGTESFAGAMSDNGQMVGGYYIGGGLRGFTWTRARGMVDLGSFGGADTNALAINNKGQIVGSSRTKRGEFRGFVWSARDGMVDLNKRLRHAPPGLVVELGLVISDNGSIVALSNAGMVLLRPDCGCKGTHTVGPIVSPDMVEVGTPFDSSVSFAGADTSARHNVIWSFGDGSGDRAGNARANNGAGSATGRHFYTAPGIYTMTANVVDLAGKSATVGRTVVAYDRSAGVVAGSGSFISPHGANRREIRQPGKAAFSFVSPSIASAKASGAKAELRFLVGTLGFWSDNVSPVSVGAGRGQFEGSGTINGQGDYRFTLAVTSGAAAGAGGSFGLKVWHTDPTTGAAVIDYDNLVATPGSAGSLVEGKILLPQ